MGTSQLLVLLLVFVQEYSQVSGTVDDNCTNTECATGEVCVNNVCACDAANNFVNDGSGTCKKDCGNPSFPGYTLGSPTPNTLSGATVNVPDCATGYEATSNVTSSLTCTTAGSWDQPSGCTKKDCGPPSPTETGYILGNYTSTNYESTITIHCNEGYEGSPNPIVCQSDSYWSTPVGCSRVECGIPSFEDTRYVVENYQTTDYESSATVNCSDGYEGSPGSVTCQSDGNWTTPTGCNPIDCASATPAGYLIRGAATYGGGEVTVECDTGYGVIPTTTTMTCQTNGEWSAEFAGCLRDCGDPVSPTGYNITIPASTLQNDTATVWCATGYQETDVPPSLITCQENGAWTVPSGCIGNIGSSCNANEDCFGVGEICSTSICVCDEANGYINDSDICKKVCSDQKDGYNYDPPTENTEGSTITVIGCDTANNYTGSPSPSILTCGNDGIWTDVTGCYKPGIPTASVSLDGANFTSRTYTCMASSTTLPADSGFPFTYEWFYEGTMVDPTDDTDRFYITSDNTITISDIDVADNGKEIGCTATEDVARGLTSAANIVSVTVCPVPPKEGYAYETPTGTAAESSVNITGCDNGINYIGNPSRLVLTCGNDGSWTDVTGCYKPGIPTAYVSLDSADSTTRTYTCTATSTTLPLDSGFPFTYEWSFDGTMVDLTSVTDRFSTTNNTITIFNIAVADNGKKIACNVTEDVAGGLTSNESSVSITVCPGPTKVGYVYGTPSGTEEGSNVTVTGCSSTDSYTGNPSPSTLLCGNDGSWTDVTGCFKPGIPEASVALNSADSRTRTYTCTATTTTLPVDSGFPFTYEWSYDGTRVDPTDDTDRFSNTTTNTIIISDIRVDDNGKEIACTVTEDVIGGLTSAPTFVSVIVCPAPMKEGYSYDSQTGTSENSTVIVNCDTANGYIGTPSPGTSRCDNTGSWTDVTGCYKPAYGVACSAEAGCENTTTLMECKENSATGGGFRCYCQSGYTGRSGDSACLAIVYGVACSIEAGCDDTNRHMECRDSSGTGALECYCQTGYRGASGDPVCQAIELGDTCESAADCTAVDNNRTCSDSPGVCVCKDTHIDSDGDTVNVGGTCEQIPCLAPPTVSHSTISVSKNGDTVTATYNCTLGYELQAAGISSKTCGQGDTEWSTDVVACVLKDCGKPNAVDGYIIETDPSPTTYLSSANVTGCSEGYKGSPNLDTIMCEASGEWSEPTGCLRRVVGDTCTQDSITDCSLITDSECKHDAMDNTYKCLCMPKYFEAEGAENCRPTAVNDPCPNGAIDCSLLHNTECDPDPDDGTNKCLCNTNYSVKVNESTCTVDAIEGECPNGISDCGSFNNVECRQSGGTDYCLCKVGYIQEPHGDTCTVQEIGGECPNGFSDCGSFFNVECREEEEGSGIYKCLCKDGYSIKPNDDACTVDVVGGSCPNGITDCDSLHNIECRNETGDYQCLCQSGYSLKAGDTKCTVDSLGTACPNGISDCADINNVECPAAVEGGEALCLCQSGYSNNTGNNECTVEAIGGACPNGLSDCGIFEYTECRNDNGTDKCLCKVGYSVKDGETTCTSIGLGDECSTTEDCTVALNNSKCNADGITNVCACNTGYKENSGGCESYNLNDPCSDDVDCNTNNPHSVCKNESGSPTCACETGYKDVSGSCILYGLDDTCTTSEDCNTAIPNSECKTEGSTSTCKCSIGYKAEGAGCITYVLGDACTQNEECNTTNPYTKCTEVCTCLAGYRQDQDECVPFGLGDTCAHDVDCNTLTENSGCKNENGILTCSCSVGYRNQNDNCVKYVLGDFCTENIQCETFNADSECAEESSKCSCKTGYRNLSGTCVPYVLNDMCDSGSIDCATSVSNSDCTPVSSGTFRCQCKDGYYGESGASECETIPCDAPPEVPHATLDLTKDATAFVATFSCARGYDMPDALMNKKQCLLTGSTAWSTENVTCLITGDCPEDPPTVSHTTVTLSSDGNTATYSCIKGYQLKNVAIKTSTCDGSSKLWSTVGELCVIRDCGDPESLAPTHGSITLDGDLTTYGATATVSCEEGYTMSGTGTTITCLDTKQWSSFTVTCKIKDCLKPPTPAHGSVTLSETNITTYTATATQSCDAGYSLSGVSNIRCTADGTWSAGPVNCTIKDCGEENLPHPSNGVSKLDVTNSTTYGATATQSCNEGYTPSAEGLKLTCQYTGEWENVTLTCTIKDCGAKPNLTNGIVQLDANGNTKYNAIGTLQCNTGYVTNSNQTEIKCSGSGQWEQITSACVKKDCNEPSTPENGVVEVNEGTKFEAVAYQSCNLGYDSSGSTTIKCLSTGQWSASPVICSPKDCGHLWAPVNGKVNDEFRTASSTYETVAVFTCDDGYSLTGVEKRRCGPDGTWSGEENPTCTIKSTATCGDPTPVTHATFVYNADATEAIYSCFDGYELADAANNKLQCSNENTWTGTLPVCNLKENRKNLSLTLTIDIVLPAVVDLTDNTMKRHYMFLTENVLRVKIRASMNNNNVDVIVIDIRRGSYIVDMETIFPTGETETVIEATTQLLQSNETVTIEGISGEVNRLQIGDATYTLDIVKEYQCKAFEELEGACPSRYECVVVDGVATCQPLQEPDNFAVIIGVGIGVPLGLFAIALIVFCGIVINRKSRRSDGDTDSEVSDGVKESHFKMPLRYSGGYRAPGVYGPAVSFPESESPHRQRVYGAAVVENLRDSQLSQQQRYAEDETTVDSNFSWDFMYKTPYPPGRKFEIQRPKY